METRQDGYAIQCIVASFNVDESVYGSQYLQSTETYAGAYRLGNPWYITEETISNGFSHNAAENKTYYQLKLDYQREFDRHNVSAMVLFNRSSRAYDNRVEYRYQGISGRATYAYDNKYLTEFNIGYNGS